MIDQRNTVKVFVVASSGPIRRSLLRIINDIPAAELVGVSSNKFVSMQSLADLGPDLLLLNPEPERDIRQNLFNYLSQHLPRCKTVILSKPAKKDISMVTAAVNENAGISSSNGPPSVLVDPDDQMHIRAEIQKFIIEKAKADKEEQHVAMPDGTAAYLFDYIESVSNGNQQKLFSGVLRNITERRRKNSGRRRTELNRAQAVARLQSFVEQLPGIPYIAPLDNDGNIIYVSPRIEEVLGFSPRQWCANPGLRIKQLHLDDRDAVLRAVRSAVDTASGYMIDYRIYGHDGSLRWFHDEAQILVGDSGKPLFLQGAMIDITERKQAQEELERSHSELQDLIKALDSLRIEEQRRLAHEMHDDFGQLLAALKIDLHTLQRHLPNQDPEAVKYLNSINELVDAMVTSVRRIIANLPSKLVEDLGLFNALQSMASNVEKRHHISCHLRFSGLEPELDTDFATSLFRMVQEALNNVVKHAHATSVQVQVDCSNASIALSVIDNGQGMATDCQRKAGSFGLIGMRERVTALGGAMKVESRIGKGTGIQIVIPANTPITQGHQR